MRRLLNQLFEIGQNLNHCGAGKVINRPECAVDSFTGLQKAGAVPEMTTILIISQIPENGNINRLQPRKMVIWGETKSETKKAYKLLF